MVVVLGPRVLVIGVVDGVVKADPGMLGVNVGTVLVSPGAAVAGLAGSNMFVHCEGLMPPAAGFDAPVGGVVVLGMPGC